jgi:predicted Zn-dependent protease
VSGLTTLGLRAYSRSQEEEADRRAVELLRAAGYPDWMLRYTLERLRYAGATGSGDWLSTHPAISERIAAQPTMEDGEVRRRCGRLSWG